MKKFIPLLVLFLVFDYLNTHAQEKPFVLDTIYSPANGKVKNVAVIYWGGSDGGIPTWDFERDSLPQMGYPTLGIGYFKTPNTPQKLEMIPLEYIFQAINAFCDRPELRGKKIVIDGVSKGAELALLVASMTDKIDGVVAMAPSAVVWQGIPGFNEEGNALSSWSHQGNSLSFVPYAPYDWSKLNDGKLLDFYTKSLNQKEYIESAAIKVENISGPVLLFSGKEDILWPSDVMGEMIIDRLKQHNFKYEFQHFQYPDVNHGFSADNADKQGGTKEANAKAMEDFKKKLLELLENLNSM